MFIIPAEAKWQRLSLTVWRKTEELLILPVPTLRKFNPVVVQVMQEIGIDISHEKPKLLTIELMDKFDRVITMGCGVEETCPASFLPTEDWDLDDPEAKR